VEIRGTSHGDYLDEAKVNDLFYADYYKKIILFA